MVGCVAVLSCFFCWRPRGELLVPAAILARPGALPRLREVLSGLWRQGAGSCARGHRPRSRSCRRPRVVYPRVPLLPPQAIALAHARLAAITTPPSPVLERTRYRSREVNACLSYLYVCPPFFFPLQTRLARLLKALGLRRRTPPWHHRHPPRSRRSVPCRRGLLISLPRARPNKAASVAARAARSTCPRPAPRESAGAGPLQHGASIEGSVDSLEEVALLSRSARYAPR